MGADDLESTTRETNPECSNNSTFILKLRVYRGSLSVALGLGNAMSDHFWKYHGAGTQTPQPSSWLSGTRTCPEDLHTLNWHPLDQLV